MLCFETVGLWIPNLMREKKYCFQYVTIPEGMETFEQNLRKICKTVDANHLTNSY